MYARRRAPPVTRCSPTAARRLRMFRGKARLAACAALALLLLAPCVRTDGRAAAIESVEREMFWDSSTTRSIVDAKSRPAGEKASFRRAYLNADGGELPRHGFLAILPPETMANKFYMTPETPPSPSA